MATLAAGRFTDPCEREAAGSIRLSEETVKVHMKSIMAKLAANNRTHAVTIAVKRGIIDI